MIVAWSREGAGTPEVHRYALQTMARSLKLILQWRQQVTSLRLAARRDPLTGLPNRTSFFEVLDGLEQSATGDADRRVSTSTSTASRRSTTRTVT